MIQTSLVSENIAERYMKVSAKVTISNGTFEEWVDFFDSYKIDRQQFITDEVIEQLSVNEARVEFEIQDLEGLTALSSRTDIISREEELGVKTEIN